jgi:hypothetical protein
LRRDYASVAAGGVILTPEMQKWKKDIEAFLPQGEAEKVFKRPIIYEVYKPPGVYELIQALTKRVYALEMRNRHTADWREFAAMEWGRYPDVLVPYRNESGLT